MMESFTGVIMILGVAGFWAFIAYVFWHILQTLKSIDRSVDDMAKTLRNGKSS